MMSREARTIGMTLMLLHFVVLVTGEKWLEFDGRCYTVLDQFSDYKGSKELCQKLESDVVELAEKAEFEYVKNLIAGSNSQYWVMVQYNSTDNQCGETSKQWSLRHHYKTTIFDIEYYWERSRQRVSISMWLPGEPNLSGSCVRLATEAQTNQTSGTSNNQNFMLADHPCSNKYKVICEKSFDLGRGAYYQIIKSSSASMCPIKTYIHMSSLHCALDCSSNKDCLGFQYSERTKNCTQHTSSSACSNSSKLPLVFYKMTSVRC